MSGPISFTEVRWRPVDSDGVWEIRRLNENQKSVYIEGTDRGVAYVIEARNVGPTGLSSNWVSALHTPVLLDRPLTPLLIDDLTGAVEVDCKVEEQFSLLLSREVTSVSFINVPEEKIIIIVVVQGGSFGIVWPSSVVFESGELYIPTQLVGRADTIGLATVSSGTEWVLKSSVDVDPTGDGTIPGGGSPDLPEGVDPIDVQVDPVFAECDAVGAVGCIPSAQATTVITGGTPPYSVTWARVVGSDVSQIDSVVAQNPIFSVADGLTKVDDQSTWRASVVDSTGVLVTKNLAVHLIRNANDLAVSGLGTAFGFCVALGIGTCTPTASTNLSVLGGVPPYSHLWSKVSGSSEISISDTSVLNPVFRAPDGRFIAQWDATWKYRATDSTGNFREKIVDINLGRETNQ